MSALTAVKEVRKEIETNYCNATVYCLESKVIDRKLEKIYSEFKEGRKRYADGRTDKEGNDFTAVAKFKRLIEKKDTLFDCSTDNPQRKLKCSLLWDVKMGEMEKIYLEDQKGNRKMHTQTQPDPVWYRAAMKAKRLQERSEEDFQERLEERDSGKSFEQLEQVLADQGMIPSASSPESTASTPAKVTSATPTTPHLEDGAPAARKKKLFVDNNENTGDNMPEEYRNIRHSEKGVKDEFYQTMANLTGKGLSVNEAATAIVEVGRGMFNRKNWKKSEDKDTTFDKYTTPHKSSILEHLKRIEVQSLNLVVGEMVKAKEEGHMLTLASDSTTRREVGKFIGEGIHIGQGSAYPLPLLPVSSESREDIALQLGMGLELLAISSSISVEKLAAMVDTLLTDSVEHNKGVNEILADMYNLDEAPGQLFCGSHTVLGFSNAMNKVVMAIELKMGLDKVLAGFMVGMDLDSKHGSLAGQSLDMILRLVAPEYKHKSWNYHGTYNHFLQERGLDLTLFSYKDQRFGCLSRASAVCLNNYPHIEGFLSTNPQISNKLACLIRELQNLPHLKVIYCVFALLGVQLIEPFYAITITTGTTHSMLSTFYKNLYTSLSTQKIFADFLSLTKPFFPGISEKLFTGVKKSYGRAVLKSIIDVGEEHSEDVLMLINQMLPELGRCLAKQRRDYSLDTESFPVEYPVQEQASNVDDTPVNNMDMERLMGTTDYRLHKVRTLAAASRGIILGKTQDLREASQAIQGSSFRSFRKQVETKREKEIEWNLKQKERFADVADMVRVVALGKERKRLDLLEKLKGEKGPFTSAEEVQSYMNSDMEDKVKQARMKREMQFARDSSTTLPRVDPLFKIQVTLKDRKRRDKTAEEFADSLMAYLGKKGDRTVMEYETFRRSLRALGS